MPIRSTVVLLVLALAAFGSACRDEGPAERALESVEKTAREVGETIDQEAHGLAEAAQEGGAARAAEAALRAGHEAVDTVETPGGVEAVAEELSGNVQNAVETYDETYDAARQQGENPIAAGGEAYNEVSEIPEEKDEE